MTHNFERFNYLKSEKAVKIMLKSVEARGGYMHKEETEQNERLHQVKVPLVKGGFLETYCEEY